MNTRLRYLGFSGFEITTSDDVRIVIDPFLTGSEAHGVPPSPVPLDALDETDIVLVSHGAFDHLGQAIDIVKRSGATLVCGPDVRIHALREGIPSERIAYVLSGSTIAFDAGVTVKVLDVRHISLFQSGDDWLSGQPLSFILRTDGGPTIYHSGDTSLYGDLKLFGELHRPEVGLICVGGVRSHGYDVVPLPPDEAALAAEWLGVRLAIPMHYRPDSDAVEAFDTAMAARAGASVYAMQAGETVVLEELLKKES